VLDTWREAVDLKSVSYGELTSGKYAYLGLDGKCRGYCIIMNERDKNYISVIFFTGSEETSYPIVDKDKYNDFDCFIWYEA